MFRLKKKKVLEVSRSTFPIPERRFQNEGAKIFMEAGGNKKNEEINRRENCNKSNQV